MDAISSATALFTKAIRIATGEVQESPARQTLSHVRRAIGEDGPAHSRRPG